MFLVIAPAEHPMVSKSHGGGRVPKPLYELAEGDLARKRDTGRVASAALRRLVGISARKDSNGCSPVITSKTTDPLWPDPGASIERGSSYGDLRGTRPDHAERDRAQARRLLTAASEAVRHLPEHRDRKGNGSLREGTAYEFHSDFDFEIETGPTPS